MDTFHWAIFVLHLSAALVITAGVWLRCDQEQWVSRMSVDSYTPNPGGGGLWWDTTQEWVEECSNGTQTAQCFRRDLPLYEKVPAGLGWHLFALLGHFEWVSAAFAFFYIKGGWHRWSWLISTGVCATGTGIFLVSGRLFTNEAVVLSFALAGSTASFYLFRGLHAGQGAIPGDSWDTSSLHMVQAPVLRFLEYSITASELYVAVLAVFVIDPPAYMSLGGYALIAVCNLYGAMLHYNVASYHVTQSLSTLPPPNRAPNRMRTDYAPLPDSTKGEDLSQLPRAWGSYAASNASTLANSWMVFTVAICLIFYQQTFLFSGDPPAFVVFAGWSLLVFYGSFGAWATAVYAAPGGCIACLGCVCAASSPYTLLIRGLDILSVGAKLSIVTSLASGFVFQGDGRC